MDKNGQTTKQIFDYLWNKKVTTTWIKGIRQILEANYQKKTRFGVEYKSWKVSSHKMIPKTLISLDEKTKATDI